MTATLETGVEVAPSFDVMAFAKRFGAFALVGASGVPVNVATMWALHAVGMNYLLAAILSTQVAIAWNFALSEWWVFRDHRDHHDLFTRTWRYALVNNADTLVRIPLLALLVEQAGVRPAPANLLLIVVASVAKYAVVKRLVYRTPTFPALPVAPEGAL